MSEDGLMGIGCEGMISMREVNKATSLAIHMVHAREHFDVNGCEGVISTSV